MPDKDEELFEIILKAHQKGVKQAIDLSIRNGTPLIGYKNGKVVKIYPKYKYVKVPIKPKKGKIMQKSLNLYIDQTLLKPEATQEEIQKLCEESIEFQFATVFVHPAWAKLAHSILKGSPVKLGCPVGFPLGANTKEVKAYEATQLAEMGAGELDMVINIGALKSKNYQEVQKDIEAVVKAAPKALIKVILETCLLTDEEKQIACKLTVDAGAHFVKTSTGFSKSGATVHDIALLRNAVGPDFGVKASGGIRDLATALAMIEAGATRIGTSSGIAIVENFKAQAPL